MESVRSTPNSPELPAPIRAAIAYWQGTTAQRPAVIDVVTALQQLEKHPLTADAAAYTALIGDWRLAFITGTRQARQKAAPLLNSGRFLPKWVGIQLVYGSALQLSMPMATSADSAAPNSAAPAQLGITPHPQGDTSTAWSGTVQNRVKFAGLDLTLTGPVQFHERRQILAFDFTRLSLKVLQRSLYHGYIRGGQNRELNFAQQTLKEQAFFKYFLIHPDCIAARGRGGGLALWVRG